ncbi:MAG: EamA family transporter [Streptosporangiaceae bacterium]
MGIDGAEPYPSGVVRLIPSPLLVLLSILSVQFGAGLAKGMFDRLPPAMVVLLRLGTSAVVVGFLARRSLRTLLGDHTRRDLAIACGLGLSLALMNYSIYQALQTIPLGVAVTIEFLGPLLVSVLATRRFVDLLWAVLALLGVVLLSRSGGDVELTGVLWAALGGVGWGVYILAGSATGRRFAGNTGLALASLVGTVAIIPMSLAQDGTTSLGHGFAQLTPALLALGIVVGLLSSVVPYTLEMEALRRIPPRVFGILMSLEPAVAALVGMIVLSERLSAVQWLAICSVVLACAGATRSVRAS